MSVQGPLVIPGPPLGPLDARVNFWTYVPTSLFLGALDVINPEMVLGQGVLSWVTGDEEMKTMLRKDGLRWTSGVKVSGGPKSGFIYDFRKIFRLFYPLPPCHCPTHATYHDFHLLFPYPAPLLSANVLNGSSLTP